MANKTLPFSLAQIEQIAAEYPTPFHIYDERGIRQRMRDLLAAFAWNEGFQQCFAVKAAPNPHLMQILIEEGSGADCSSPAELAICERLGLTGEKVMFTSNNTTLEEFEQAHELGAVINLDTPDHLDKIAQLSNLHGPSLPNIISFRYNPGPDKAGNVIIGDPKEAKFGCTKQQILEGYRRCQKMGIERFGLHTMVVSNEIGIESLLETARMVFDLAVLIHKETGIRLDFINLGGGIGVAYRPEEEAVDLKAFGDGVHKLYDEILGGAGLSETNGAPLQIMMENGRTITGPFGTLITRVINVKESYKKYIGVDANMANLMRPGMYGAYHHISKIGAENEPSTQTVDVVGALCENNDKFAIDRQLPEIKVGDLLAIHDAGAHGHSMGFQYNGRLRSAELLLCEDGSVKQIRRAETLEDYFSTVEFPVGAGVSQ